jgi:hypothetical protein
MMASSGPSGVIIWVGEGGCMGGKRAGREEGDIPGGWTLIFACSGAGPILDIQVLDIGLAVLHVVE